MGETMSAYVVNAAGPPSALLRQTIGKPEPKPGWVTIEVKAFGLNRSEMFTRQGHSPGVEFPRVLGIECVGLVDAPSDSGLSPGEPVAAMMGGMGREFDGAYAEYTQVPKEIVFKLNSTLPWSVLGALPEMFQTAWGSLHRALTVQAGETLLVRGATSSVGLMSILLAKGLSLEVTGTTRSPEKIDMLERTGADHVVIDNGAICGELKKIHANGVDAVLELVGTKTLRDSLQCCRQGGTVCMTGILGNEWQLSAFTPMEEIPHTTRLTVYSGGPQDLAKDAFDEFLDSVAATPDLIPIDSVFTFDRLVEAHEYMESNRAQGKLVVVL